MAVESARSRSKSVGVACVTLVLCAIEASVSLAVDLRPVMALPMILGTASIIVGLRHAYRVGAPRWQQFLLPRAAFRAVGRNGVALVAVTGIVTLTSTIIGGGLAANVTRVDGVPQIDNHGSGPVISEARYGEERRREPRTWATIIWIVAALSLVLASQTEWPDVND